MKQRAKNLWSPEVAMVVGLFGMAKGLHDLGDRGWSLIEIGASGVAVYVAISYYVTLMMFLIAAFVLVWDKFAPLTALIGAERHPVLKWVLFLGSGGRIISASVGAVALLITIFNGGVLWLSEFSDQSAAGTIAISAVLAVWLTLTVVQRRLWLASSMLHGARQVWRMR